VAKLVRNKGVKAVLSGEGSDECFLGYRSIPYTDLNAWYERRVAAVGRLVRKIPRVGEALWVRSGDPAGSVSLLSRFEREIDERSIREHVTRVSGRDVHPKDYRSLQWLSYHLRTLLHRNDTLGMAASIEARFPFLDHDVVRFAVNMPYSTKIRPSIRSFNRSHPFIRDKWALREVANRYLPRSLSQRKKLGFPTNAYERATIDDDYLMRSSVADAFRLSEKQSQLLVSSAEAEYRVRLLFLDVWMRLFVLDETIPQVQARLGSAVRIAPAA
jgi:asparagine synthase (glutamine-hydrolysing)